MRKFTFLLINFFVLSSVVHGAQRFDPGAKVLGEKSSFQHADKLQPVDASFLVQERDASMCMGGDIHDIPKLEQGEEFVVGFPSRSGGEKLIHIWNNKGAKTYLHCILEPALKAHYYFIAPEYVDKSIIQRETDWAEFFNLDDSPDTLRVTIFDQAYHYYLGERTSKNLLRELNTDMLTHVFISPLVKAHGFKVFTDLESSGLYLFAQKFGSSKRYSLGELDNLETSSQIVQKVVDFAEKTLGISDPLSVAGGSFTTPDISAFDEQLHLSSRAIETMVMYYVNALKKINPLCANWTSQAVKGYRLE